MFIGAPKTTRSAASTRCSEDDIYGGMDDNRTPSGYRYSPLPSPTSNGVQPKRTLEGLERHPNPNPNPSTSPLRPPVRPFQYESTHSSSASLSSLSIPLHSENRGTWRSDISGTSTATNMDAFAFRSYETQAASAPQVIVTEPTTPRRGVIAGLGEWREDEEQSTLKLIGIADEAKELDARMTPSSSAGRTKSLFKASNFSRPLRAPTRADSLSSEARSSYERSESVLSTYSTSSSIPSVTDSQSHKPSCAASPYSETSLNLYDAPRSYPTSPMEDLGSYPASPSSPFPMTQTTAPVRRATNPIRLRPPRTPPSAPPPPAPASWSGHDDNSPTLPPMPQREEAAQQPQPYHRPLHQYSHLPSTPHPPRQPSITTPEQPVAGRHPAQFVSVEPSQVRAVRPDFARGNMAQSPTGYQHQQQTRTQIIEHHKGRAPPSPPSDSGWAPSQNRPSPTGYSNQEMDRLGTTNLSVTPLKDRFSFYDPELLPRSPGASSQGSCFNTPSPLHSPFPSSPQAPHPPTERSPVITVTPTTRPKEQQHRQQASTTRTIRANSPNSSNPHSRDRGEEVITEPRTAEDYLQLGITHHQNDRLVDSARCFEISAKGPGVLLRVSQDRASAGRPSGGSEVGGGDPGCAVGMLMWGLTLRSGWGVKPDEEKGFKWLRRAAELAVEDLEVMRTHVKPGDGKLTGIQTELVLAIYEVGQCFFHGWGVKKDQKMAVSYFLVAARMGDVDAQQELAFCYLNGSGTKKDKKEAAKWYKRAESPSLSPLWHTSAYQLS
ncbi:hypothetical protein FRB98_008209 [Tulasnella sp. 332]|nr:hypothetical protein FRB98_008209 [Tulasnella sp. 332]